MECALRHHDFREMLRHETDDDHFSETPESLGQEEGERPAGIGLTRALREFSAHYTDAYLALASLNHYESSALAESREKSWDAPYRVLPARLATYFLYSVRRTSRHSARPEDGI